MLAELGVDERKGEFGAVNGHVQVLQNVGQRAYVVLVTVSEHYALHLLFVREKIGYVGDNQIDARHVAVGESTAAVDDDYFVAVLKRSHVFTDFPHAAYKNNLKRGFIKTLSQN